MYPLWSELCVKSRLTVPPHTTFRVVVAGVNHIFEPCLLNKPFGSVVDSSCAARGALLSRAEVGNPRLPEIGELLAWKRLQYLESVRQRPPTELQTFAESTQVKMITGLIARAHHRRDVKPMPVGGEVRIRMQDGHPRIFALPHGTSVAHILRKEDSASLYDSAGRGEIV